MYIKKVKIKLKRLPKDVMNAVYFLVAELKTKGNSRYDIELDLENRYSLIFHKDLSNEKLDEVIIQPCEGFNFAQKLNKLINTHERKCLT